MVLAGCQGLFLGACLLLVYYMGVKMIFLVHSSLGGDPFFLKWTGFLLLTFGGHLFLPGFSCLTRVTIFFKKG